MSKKTYSGINIQWPISRKILEKLKTIETRTYPIPEKFLLQELLIVETPGKKGKFKSRIIGIIVFEKSFLYKTKKEFYNDYDKHLVDKESEWSWKDKPKYGWVIKSVTEFEEPRPLNKRPGIKYTNDIYI